MAPFHTHRMQSMGTRRHASVKHSMRRQVEMLNSTCRMSMCSRWYCMRNEGRVRQLTLRVVESSTRCAVSNSRQQHTNTVVCPRSPTHLPGQLIGDPRSVRRERTVHDAHTVVRTYSDWCKHDASGVRVRAQRIASCIRVWYGQQLLHWFGDQV